MKTKDPALSKIQKSDKFACEKLFSFSCNIRLERNNLATQIQHQEKMRTLLVQKRVLNSENYLYFKILFTQTNEIIYEFPFKSVKKIYSNFVHEGKVSLIISESEDQSKMTKPALVKVLISNSPERVLNLLCTTLKEEITTKSKEKQQLPTPSKQNPQKETSIPKKQTKKEGTLKLSRENQNRINSIQRKRKLEELYKGQNFQKKEQQKKRKLETHSKSTEYIKVAQNTKGAQKLSRQLSLISTISPHIPSSQSSTASSRSLSQKTAPIFTHQPTPSPSTTPPSPNLFHKMPNPVYWLIFSYLGSESSNLYLNKEFSNLLDQNRLSLKFTNSKILPHNFRSLLRRSPNLKTLTISALPRISSAVLTSTCFRLNQLISLDLSLMNQLNQKAFLFVIRNARKLKALSIPLNGKLNDDALRGLREMKLGIKQFSFLPTNVGNMDVLEYSKVNVSCEVLAELIKALASSLKMLNLYLINTLLLNVLSQTYKIQTLHISVVGINVRDLKPLAKLQNLSTFSLCQHQVVPFSQFTQTHLVNLQNAFKDLILAFKQDLLKDLRIGFFCNPEIVEAICERHSGSLKFFGVQSHNIKDEEVWEIMDRCKNIYGLDVSYCVRISQFGFEEKECKSLKFLRHSVHSFSELEARRKLFQKYPGIVLQYIPLKKMK